MSYPSNLYVYGVYLRAGVRSMDGYHMGKVVKIVYRITVPIILTVPIKYFLTLGQSKLVSSLTP